jgi:hypothetical protein
MARRLASYMTGKDEISEKSCISKKRCIFAFVNRSEIKI